MDYKKIIELTQKCQMKQDAIMEFYRIMGANPNLPTEIQNFISNTIANIQKELEATENKLRKAIS